MNHVGALTWRVHACPARTDVLTSTHSDGAIRLEQQSAAGCRPICSAATN